MGAVLAWGAGFWITSRIFRQKVETTDTLGINADWLEAFAFAWLSRQTILKIPSNLCSITGAKGERILGAIYHA